MKILETLKGWMFVSDDHPLADRAIPQDEYRRKKAKREAEAAAAAKRRAELLKKKK